MIIRILGIAVVVALLVGLVAYSQFRGEPLKVSGFIEADEIRLGSRVGGRVAKVLVEEGQRVQPNDALVELEPFDLREQEKKAQAELAARQAEYDRLDAGLRPQEIAQAQARVEQLQAQLKKLKAGPRPQEIAAARAQLDAAQAQLKLADREYRRDSELYEKNMSISRQQLDLTIERFEVAQAQVAARKQELELLELGTREEEIEQAEAALEEAQQALELAQAGFRQEEVEKARAARDAARASLEAIRQRLQELTIASPVEGVVEALDLQKGDLVAAGAPVMSVMDDSHLWVRAYVPEDELDINAGQPVAVTVDSFPEERFEGEITFISRQAEFTPSNVQTPKERSKQVFRIKVTLLEGLGKLRPGMAADVWLDVRSPAFRRPSARMRDVRRPARPLAGTARRLLFPGSSGHFKSKEISLLPVATIAVKPDVVGLAYF